MLGFAIDLPNYNSSPLFNDLSDLMLFSQAEVEFPESGVNTKLGQHGAGGLTKHSKNIPHLLRLKRRCMAFILHKTHNIQFNKFRCLLQASGTGNQRYVATIPPPSHQFALRSSSLFNFSTINKLCNNVFYCCILHH